MTIRETQRFSLRARYVFPQRLPPIENGMVHVREGRVAAIEPFRGQTAVQDLGDVGLLPALINAHTHLEFSDLAHPLGVAGQPFRQWIDDVIAHRQAADQASLAGNEFSAATPSAALAIRRGVEESYQACIDYVGEITTTSNLQPYARSAIGGVLFRELMGLTSDRIAQAKRDATSFLAAACPFGWTRGLSPHAPYTASLELVKWCVEQCAARRMPLAMHLAETTGERMLLASRSGPLRELLEARGVWEPSVFPPTRQMADYLEVLSRGWKSLVIHGNYLTAAEQQFLAQKRDVLSVIFCPRTHAFFGHASYPLAQLLRAGVRVAVGTDSRASNPDLNLWNDLTWIARHHEQVDAETIVAMATTTAAEALGLPVSAGTIAIGGPARFHQVPLSPDRSTNNNPYELLFDRGA